MTGNPISAAQPCGVVVVLRRPCSVLLGAKLWALITWSIIARSLEIIEFYQIEGALDPWKMCHKLELPLLGHQRMVLVRILPPDSKSFVCVCLKAVRSTREYFTRPVSLGLNGTVGRTKATIPVIRSSG